MKINAIRPTALLFLIFLAAMCSPIWLISRAGAAEVTASLSGNVRDASGAIVPGASVILKNADTNATRTTHSNGDGTYLFTLVPIGNYSVTVEQKGFRRFVQSGITLQVNQNAKLDVTLQVGTTGDVIEVTENVAQVDTLTATLGSVETQRRILDLPLVERDTFQLGLLQTGVFAPDPDDGSGNPFSVSGQRSESLTFLVNGVDNNDFLGNNAVVDPNPDAVAEFKILTNNYSAEFGRSSGGIVNQVIKSGTNGFHGSAFDFFRHNALNARDYFLPEVTPYQRNLFGGTLGGPIVKNKTFFFISYQGLRRHEGQVAPKLQVLSPAERTGDFSELLTGLNPVQLTDPLTGDPYPNNQVPVNPVMANYIARFLPLPNLSDNNFISSPVANIREDQGIIRIDHHISQADTISGSYIINDHSAVFPFRIIKGASSGGNVPIGSGFSEAIRGQQGSLTWTHLFTPRLINEAVFGANRSATLQGDPTDHTTPQELGFANVNPDDPAGAAPPIIFTNSFNLGPSPQGPTTLHDATFHWQDNVSWSKGRHDLKFGVDIRRVRNNFQFDFFNNGSFTFTSGQFTGDAFADFVGGFWDNYFQFASATYGIRTSSMHFYGQDSWKIRPHLTLTYGLRYEYNTPQIDPHDNVIGFYPGHQSTVFPAAPPGLLYPGDPGTPNRALIPADRNNLAPRVGFAWDMFGNAKLVMRGGAGIFYDIEDGALNLQFGGQPPFGAVANFFPSGLSAGVDPVSDPFTTAGSANPFPFIAGGHLGEFICCPTVGFAFVVDPHFRTPYSESFNFGFEYQLTKDTMVEANYVGSLGRKLISSAEVNFPDPNIMRQQINLNGAANIDCARPLAGCGDPLDPAAIATQATQLFTNVSNGSSASHQLQLTIDKRFSGGFNLRGAYTLSKTIDVTSGFRSRSSTFTNPLDPRFDRALADFDATHRLVISGFWELPGEKLFQNSGGFLRQVLGGWQIGGIAVFQSGNPFTLFSNNNSSDQNTFLDRPDLLGNVQTFDPRRSQIFSPAANGVNGSCLNGEESGNYFFDPTQFDCSHVPELTFGTTPRNFLRGPGINNFDISIIKHFKITESRQVEFRTEFFNAFNHAQFLNPNNQGFSGNFGQITQARDPRRIQFGLKVYF